MNHEHQPVMAAEAIAALLVKPGGAYVDCTYGRGGHAMRLAAALGGEGMLLLLDRDDDAIAHAKRLFTAASASRGRFNGASAGPRIFVQKGSFADLAALVRQHGMEPLDGVLLDLGVSSPQLEDAQRGFSFHRPGPLDMRMDQSSGATAAEWLASASEAEIAWALRAYGEEPRARRLARRLVAARREAPIDTTERLAALVAAEAPPVRSREGHAQKHPATRSFQAIRMQVNGELQALESCLVAAVALLRAGGRLVVISFHSLEDRLVKRFFRRMQEGEGVPAKLPLREAEVPRRLRLVGRAQRPSAAEVSANIRARSSIMRVAEKVA